MFGLGLTECLPTAGYLITGCLITQCKNTHLHGGGGFLADQSCTAAKRKYLKHSRVCKEFES